MADVAQVVAHDQHVRPRQHLGVRVGGVHDRELERVEHDERPDRIDADEIHERLDDHGIHAAAGVVAQLAEHGGGVHRLALVRAPRRRGVEGVDDRDDPGVEADRRVRGERG